MKRFLLFLLCSCGLLTANAQAPATDAATKLYYKVREKVNLVHDYTADVKLKMDVAFMKVPIMRGTLYFKSPNRLRLERHGGISIMPQKNLNLTLTNLIAAGNVTVIDAGYEDVYGTKTHVLRIVPEGGDIVLTKAWIDEEHLLVLRTESTTHDNGTVKMELFYGKYTSQALPDKVIFTLDVKDYKLPEGVAMDYDDGTNVQDQAQKMKVKKGKIYINYLSYQINTGLTDAVFDKKE